MYAEPRPSSHCSTLTSTRRGGRKGTGVWTLVGEPRTGRKWQGMRQESSNNIRPLPLELLSASNRHGPIGIQEHDGPFDADGYRCAWVRGKGSVTLCSSLGAADTGQSTLGCLIHQHLGTAVSSPRIPWWSGRLPPPKWAWPLGQSGGADCPRRPRRTARAGVRRQTPGGPGASRW